MTYLLLGSNKKVRRMNCPKCKVELVRAVNWAYCPECDRTFTKYDIQALTEIEIVMQRKELRDLIDLEA